MPRGGKRTGAGRPKGAVNKATAEAKAAVEASGETPLEYMIRVMRDPKANARRRDAMAAAAAPYVHHRLSSTEHSGPGDGPVQVIIHTGFKYDDDAGVKNGPEKPAGAGGA
jgi:hypothetical protein